MEKRLTARQVGMVLSLSMVAMKFLMFPALTTRFAGRDSYLSVFVGLSIDLLLLAAVLLIATKYPDTTFKELLSNAFGKWFAKLIFFIMFVYMFMKGTLLIKQMHNYLLESLFDEFKWFKFVIPMTAIIVFIISKNLRAIFRSIEFVFVVVAACIIVVLIIPITNMEVFAILPFAEYGALPVFEGFFRTCFTFGDYLIILLLMGNIKFKKKGGKVIFGFAALSAVLTVIFNIIFVCLFENISTNRNLSVTDIPLHSNLPFTIGRLDWVAIIFWIVALLLQIGVFMILATECLANVIPVARGWSVLIVACCVWAMFLIFRLNLAKIIEIIITTPFSIVILCVHFVMPIVLFLAVFVKKRRDYVRSKNLLKE